MVEVIMMVLLVAALTIPPETLELWCMLTMSLLLGSASARRHRLLMVDWGNNEKDQK